MLVAAAALSALQSSLLNSEMLSLLLSQLMNFVSSFFLILCCFLCGLASFSLSDRMNLWLGCALVYPLQVGHSHGPIRGVLASDWLTVSTPLSRHMFVANLSAPSFG